MAMGDARLTLRRVGLAKGDGRVAERGDKMDFRGSHLQKGDGRVAKRPRCLADGEKRVATREKEVAEGEWGLATSAGRHSSGERPARACYCNSSGGISRLNSRATRSYPRMLPHCA